METVAPPALLYASPARRLLAAVIDQFVISFLAAPFLGGASQRLAQAMADGAAPAGRDVANAMVATLLSIVVYSTAMHAWRGATFGKIAARIVVVNDDGSKLTLATAFVRAVALAVIVFVSAFLLVPLLINELRPIWNRKRQTWHDSAARTVVVRADSPAPEPADWPS